MNNGNIINYEFRLVVAATVEAAASEQNDRGGIDGTYDSPHIGSDGAVQCL